MPKVQLWELSDEFWKRVEPLIPQKKRDSSRAYCRKAGAGRKAKDPRKVFEGILYVLRTGCQWKALPSERFGSASSIHSYFRTWLKQGFFLSLWRAGLAEYDDMEGIAWSWQSIDGTLLKAPLGGTEDAGPNPTDRGKKRKQASFACGRTWSPAVPSRNRGEQT